MLAMTGVPGGDQTLWCSEAKWDGWRALVYIDHGLRVRTRTGRQVSDSLSELGGLADALDGHRVILDGELVACLDGVVDCDSYVSGMAGMSKYSRQAEMRPFSISKTAATGVTPSCPRMMARSVRSCITLTPSDIWW
jgi:hypothetical protein